MHVSPTIALAAVAVVALVIAASLAGRWIAAHRDRQSRPVIRPASSTRAPLEENELMRSPDYWAGLAAGARFVGTSRSRDEVLTCWEGIERDRRIGEKSERHFAVGWQRSVQHLFDHHTR